MTSFSYARASKEESPECTLTEIALINNHASTNSNTMACITLTERQQELTTKIQNKYETSEKISQTKVRPRNAKI